MGDSKTYADGNKQEETKYSPVGFESPDPEIDDSDVVCAGCGEASPASEMGVTADHKRSRNDGALIEVRRTYVHDDDDCLLRLLDTGGESRD